MKGMNPNKTSVITAHVNHVLEEEQMSAQRVF